MSNALGERVPVSATALGFVEDATIEVIVVGTFAPEGFDSFGKNVVHEFRDRSVDALHHEAEVFANFQVAQGVIVIVQKSGYPGDETVVIRPTDVAYVSV